MAKLNIRFVETAKPGKYGDGATEGLQLVVAPTGPESAFRVSREGKARQMGLGSFKEVELADARKKALAAGRVPGRVSTQ